MVDLRAPGQPSGRNDLIVRHCQIAAEQHVEIMPCREYSLADLDIAKVLIATSDLKRKCVFVVKENPGASLVRTLSKFGNHFPVGTSAAADHIREILPSHISSTSRREFFSFERYEPGISTDKPTTNDIFNLFVKGSVRSDYLSTSVRTHNFPYVIKREEVELISDKIRNGSSVTILLSRLGNGKSVLSEMICANLSSAFDVYSFVKETVAIDSEIELLRAPDRPTIIFIDDYPKHIETIRKLRLGSSNNQFLLLTARTPRHFTASKPPAACLRAE
ncbi:hypothetical protein [Ferrovibrio sp.]|uniref:hypothetical protein n=1 Tax=Ferrovibrio sp. TaxID=1917215 RepID=UPI0025C377EE|nr:hypothetical protein [Ferrovibrio sp.]